MSIDFYLVEDVIDFAVLIENKGCPLNAHELPAIQSLLLPHTIGLEHFLAFITQQRKIEVIFFGKFFVGFNGIAAHSNDLSSKVMNPIAKGTGLFGASWCVILRIKVQHDFFPFVIG